jgi:rhodanese-related sulfurtransferase
MKQFMLAAVFAAAALSPMTAFAGKPAAVEQAVEAGEVSNEQMVEYYTKGRIGKDVWVVDSRPAKNYVAGHIPGAVNLPLEVLKQDPKAADKLGIPKPGKAIFYCGGRECPLSIESAALFKKMGYLDCAVYRNGVPGWNQKMQPLMAEESFLKKGNLILIDNAVGKETIVTASNKTVQISLDDLKGEKGKKLLGGLSKNALLVVIERASSNPANAVLEELRDLEFRRLAYFPLSAWKGSLSVAPAVTEVTWAPVYGPGQVSAKAFEAAMASGQSILDVRPAADFARGHIKGALNIPFDNLEKEYAVLPKDKPIFIHCGSGAKSQKAFDLISRKGYSNLAYLDAEVSCKGEKCTVKE